MLVLKTPKTTSSVRNIYLPKTVTYALMDMRRYQERMKRDLGPEYQDFNIVVAQDNGRPFEERLIASKLRDLIAENDLKPVVFHSLRHSSTSLKLRISGGDIKSVQGDTGHAQSNMVTDIYSHIMDYDRQNLAQMVDRDFFSANSQPPKSPEDESVAQLIRMVEKKPDIAKLLLQMSQVFGT